MIWVIAGDRLFGVEWTMMRTLAGTLFLLIAIGTSSPAHACTVCHSKNPKMVRMHEALGFKECFRCHKPGSMKSGTGGREQLMTTDERCIPCHANKVGADNAPFK